jgi:hypothetical protein
MVVELASPISFRPPPHRPAACAPDRPAEEGAFMGRKAFVCLRFFTFALTVMPRALREARKGLWRM